MTREEAMQAIKEKMDYYESDKRLRGAIETLIPELKESEGEKIRKFLLRLAKRCAENSIDFLGDIKKKDVIDWLERQKDNLKSSDSIPPDCVINAKWEDRWRKVEESLPDNGRLVLAKDSIGNILLARYDGENWEVDVYDNEDYYCRNFITKWCEIPFEVHNEQTSWTTPKNE